MEEPITVDEEETQVETLGDEAKEEEEELPPKPKISFGINSGGSVMPWDSDFGKLVGEHENYLEDLFVNKNTTNIEIEEKKDESFSDEYDFIPDPIWGKSNEDVEENETQSAVVE